VKNGRLLAFLLAVATIVLVAIGTIWPGRAARVYSGSDRLVRSASTPEAAVQNLGSDIRSKAWQRAYESLANKAQFTQPEFMHDLTGYYPNLRTYTAMANFEAQPMRASATDAEFRVRMHWATVVGDAVTTRDVRVVRNGDRWQVDWPIVR
jgi:SHS2 domain-containing protein